MKTVETVSIVVIAIAVLAGGAGLLAQIAKLHTPALLMLALLAVLQLAAIARRRAGERSQVRFARDVAFLAGIACAIAFTWSPARWSLGAAVAATEFGLVLELLSRVGADELPT